MLGTRNDCLMVNKVRGFQLKVDLWDIFLFNLTVISYMWLCGRYGHHLWSTGGWILTQLVLPMVWTYKGGIHIKFARWHIRVQDVCYQCMDHFVHQIPALERCGVAIMLDISFPPYSNCVWNDNSCIVSSSFPDDLINLLEICLVPPNDVKDMTKLDGSYSATLSCLMLKQVSRRSPCDAPTYPHIQFLG